MNKGERIKQLREAHNMSQTDLANRIEVSKQTLYKYENNIVTNIPSDKIEAIAKVFNVSPSYIMDWGNSDSVTERALSFYDRFEKASPEIQSAILTLLKSTVKE